MRTAALIVLVPLLCVAAEPEPLTSAPPAEAALPSTGVQLASSRFGQAGLFHVLSAEFSRPGSVTVSGHALFSQSRGLIIPGATDTFAAGSGAVEFTPALGGLDGDEVPFGVSISVATNASGDANSATLPRTIFSLGDVRMDLRAGVRFHRRFSAAIDGLLYLPSQVDRVATDVRAASPGGLLALTVDFTDLSPVVPKVHLNGGFLRNNLGTVLEGYSGRVAAYTFQASSFNVAPLSAGAEWPLHNGTIGVTPFIEYSQELPLRAPRGTQGPQKLTPGLRFSPAPGLHLDGAVQLSLGKQTSDGLAPVAPWTVLGGVSYALWPPKTRLKEREIIREIRPPPDGAGRGQVVIANTVRPISNAILRFLPESKIPATATGEDGRFVTARVPPGEYVANVSRDGYQENSGRVKVVIGDGEGDAVVIPLTPVAPAARLGLIKGTAVDEEDKRVAIKIEFPATPGLEKQQMPFNEGVYEQKLPPGSHQMVVSAVGYLSQGFNFELGEGDRLIHDFLMRKVPQQPVAKLTAEKIVITQQVQFETNEARILQNSFYILDEVASILLTNPQIRKVRVEGHTDDRADDAYNQKLSDARSISVRDYLTQKGVSGERLEAKGYGESRPLETNTTKMGREKNRRVEFTILEQ